MNDTPPKPADGEQSAAQDDDEVKRKFREALERKRNPADAKGSGNGKGSSKIRGTHGSAAHQKSFRRKSG